MRIISGKWGGQRLVAFNSKQIRPTTDFVKENIFNMIGPDIFESSVLDLFSGTGSLSFEALSRGASSVVAVDKGKDSAQVIKKNREKLKADESFRFISRDVFSYLKETEEKFDYIFVDPPFTQKLAHKCIEELAQSGVFYEHTRIFIECVKGEEIKEEAGLLRLDRKKNYGDKLLCVYDVVEEENL